MIGVDVDVQIAQSRGVGHATAGVAHDLATDGRDEQADRFQCDHLREDVVVGRRTDGHARRHVSSYELGPLSDTLDY